MSKGQSIKKIKKTEVKDDLKSRRINPYIILIFSSILTLFAYLRSLNAPLILDDSTYIEPSRLKALFSHFSLSVRSIAELSFALNYQISGMNLIAFRVTNIIFHIFSAILASYLTCITLNLPYIKDKYGKDWDGVIPVHISLTVAVLFLLHPIQAAAVNYITQRMAIMAAMFSFSGMILYIKGAINADKKSILYYALSAISFFLAVFSKENAIMVLLMLPVYDFIFISSFRWREFRGRFIILSVLGAALALIVVYNTHAVGIIKGIIAAFLGPTSPLDRYSWSGVDIHWTPLQYILTELRIVSRYILLIIFPNPASMVFDYSNAYPVSRDLFNPISTFLSLLFLASLLFFSLRYVKRFPLVSFGIFWYLVTISLESFIAIGLDPYFEHRNYLPGLGPFLAIASLLIYTGKFEIRIKKFGCRKFHWNLSGKSELVILLAVAVVLFSLTFIRNGVWTREDLLWKDALDKSPENPRALITLSSINIKERRFKEAEEYLQRAGRIKQLTPEFEVAMLINKATLYKETNGKQEAMAILEGLTSENSLPGSWRGDVYFMAGEILREEGKLSEAKDYLEKAYKIKHDNPFLLISLGLISRSLGEIDRAEGYLKGAVEMAPEQPVPHIELGDIYFMKGDMNKAEQYYRAVLHKKVGVPEDVKRRALLNLAQIKLARGEIDESEGLFKNLIRTDPAFYPPYIFLGDIYLKRGNPDTAIFYLERALSLNRTLIKDDPNTRLIYFNLGMAYIAKGDKFQARKNFRLFLSIAEGDKSLEGQIGRAKKELAQMVE